MTKSYMISTDGVVSRRRDRRLRYLVIGIFVGVFVFVFMAQRYKNDDGASAASLAGFDPGYIISDYQMGNYNAMSEAQIQAWLSAKNPCDNRDYGYYQRLSANTKYTWHWDNGHFVCLSEEKFGHNDNEIGFQYGETAAHIIWQAAQDYRINPQVLLVLLQKETGLITDRIPNNGDYRKATGYGCPDTAACSSKYYGFRNQVRNAASLFRYVLDNGSRYYPVGNNYVQFNPSASCGGTVVNIRNRATSSLYQYTPYQPNAAALGAGYGMGDVCSSYGNRNFYSYFEDWFGGVRDEGWPKQQDLLTRNRVITEKNDLAMDYQIHITHYGWLPEVRGGEMVGTAGYGLQAEALKIKLANGQKGISYKAYLSGMGWQGYADDGVWAGSTGRGLRIEALRVKLSEDLAKEYDLYYRVHVAGIGWMDWVKNDEVAGTIEEGRWIEAFQIKAIKKIGSVLKINYQVHAAGIGWMDWVKDGEIAGTTGQARQVEAIRIKIADEQLKEYDVYYRVHVAGIGWMDWVKDGEIAGTTGQARRVEALEIKLVKKQ